MLPLLTSELGAGDRITSMDGFFARPRSCTERMDRNTEFWSSSSLSMVGLRDSADSEVREGGGDVISEVTSEPLDPASVLSAKRRRCLPASNMVELAS